ncbi:hypothetical protein [Jeongeupia sp. USM3]|uniref:hypothetical protein n=1 Tax=Jeongeupia sp. USM3 TaxID=1906741 RepID=UPI00089E0A81|nr:hypothetical protein [Jeongeupia sp. USM3]AOY01905.1 hypothetical protein BJP62_16510 [Jeongeupia sp. USM3]
MAIQHAIRLAAGQTVNLPVRPGAVLHVVHGRIALLAAPQWLAETMLPGEHPLRLGEHWLFEREGCITLRADVGAQLVYQEPAPRRRRCWFVAFWRPHIISPV